MDQEKKKHVLIQFLYYSLLFAIAFLFFRYIFYLLMPFIIGFAIAFLLHPLIIKFSRHGHIRFYSILVIFVFYTILGFLIVWLSIKGFYYIHSCTDQLPTLYEQYVAPYLSTSLSSVRSVWMEFDIDGAQLLTSIAQSVQDSIVSLLNTISSSILAMITNIISSIPKTILAFFFAILSSFYINADYTRIIGFLKRTLPIWLQNDLSSTQIFIRTTLKYLLIAYAKLMLLTFLELCIGLSLLGVNNALWIAILISLFDIVPVLGTGGVLIPWMIISFLNQQTKFTIGLLILYLTMSMIRTFIEPRVIGKQLGLHPLLMLLCMYLGGTLLGGLGMFLSPFLLLITRHLWKEHHPSHIT